MSFPKLPKRGVIRWVNPVRDQSGQAVLAWVLVTMTLFGGIISALTGYSMTTLMATKQARDFVIAGQLNSEAIQDALYQINEGTMVNTPATVDGYFDAAKLPQTANIGTQCGIPIDEAVLKKSTGWQTSRLGCGNYNSGQVGATTASVGRWQWSVELQPSITSQPRYKVTATGAYGKAKRTVTADFYGLSVTGATTDSVGGISYIMSPSGAFDHTLFGTDSISWDKVGNPLSYLTGRVGSNDRITLNKSTSTNNKVDGVHFYNYAKSAWDTRCLSVSKLDCQPIVRVPQTLALNTNLVSTYSKGCSSNPQPWIASKNAGQINAGIGNSGCYSSMVFDIDTEISGSGFFSAFVGGSVTINPGVNVKTLGSANLVIYTTGSLSLVTSNSTAAKLQMFVYAPNGGCTFVNTNTGVVPEFTGSLACRTVDLKGVTAQWKAAPAGVDTPGATLAVQPVRKVWYHDNMVEAAGQNLK